MFGEAAEVANTSLAISICTLVVVPLVTLAINAYREGRKQAGEAASAAIIEKARIEAEASVERAKVELDTKYQVLVANHQQCEKHHRELQNELNLCREQHVASELDRSKLWEAIAQLSNSRPVG